MVAFDLATADVNSLMNEIIRITLTEYNALSEKISKACPLEDNQPLDDMLDEMMEKYLDNERLLDTYFLRLKQLLKQSPPGRQELELKQKKIENLIRNNGLDLF
ncbi:uncharacterized protein LOC110379256 [Helicoverpa armigera]|uniref:Uncharacterized protein n=1 Tax=Helicoverpa armigera TaxID=29058 RepID=A0A2W1BML3_HELAM|nr:uncharacterized protein LOC110379256 [Helicoverpa armigera]XP_047041204.1 uncharacterized protein LOC124645443 [Helicoverpa zea]PZC74854.1 hypothetical protein B5X24_HaOG207118 [Helicoverpa armigera]